MPEDGEPEFSDEVLTMMGVTQYQAGEVRELWNDWMANPRTVRWMNRPHWITEEQWDAWCETEGGTRP